ncbi:MAG: BamA/TamA family outer membrane protein [Deltaproteobacteria bacterium]|nr:BamA/TamA family outer membrane protein [Deltaproteobacteria bacterium]
MRVEKRTLWFLVIVCSFTAGSLAFAEGANRSAGQGDGFGGRELDVLLDTPLPGETQDFSGIPTDAVEALLGKKIVAIEAVSPPKGLDPVSDVIIRPGMVLTRSLIRQMVNSLWESGKYRNIQISGQVESDKGVAILIYVEPMFHTSRLILFGNEALTETEVKRAIGFLPGGTIVPENEALIEIRDRLLQVYSNRGYVDATAAVRLETTDVVSELALFIEIDEGEPDKYVEVSISGLNEDLKEEQLLRYSGLKRGVVRDAESVQKGLEKLDVALFELGYPDTQVSSAYSETRIGEHRYSLTIHVTLGLKTLLEFQGNQRLRKREMQTLLWMPGFRSDVRGVEKALSQLKQFAVTHGLFHAQVSAVRRCYANPDKWYTVPFQRDCTKPEVAWQSVLFVLQEGPQVEVEDILIDGTHFFGVTHLKDEIFAFMAEQNQQDVVFESFSTNALDRVVAGGETDIAKGRTAGTLSTYSKPESVYNPEKYLKAARHIEDIYAEKGYLSAMVTDACDITSRSPVKKSGRVFHPYVYKRENNDEDGALPPCLYMDDDQTSLIVSFQIEEGIQTLIESISVEGNSPHIFTSAELVGIGELNLAQPYNEYFIRDAADLIQKAYQERGYMFVRVEWETAMSLDQTAARVVLRIEEGPQVRIGKIFINSERTNRWFIGDNLGFESGDLVTPSALAQARERVMDIGVFSVVTVQMQSPTIVYDRKNIVVTVVERKSQFLELRAGAATEQGVRGGFEYGHRNILGLAINYRLKMRANYRNRDYWFFGDEAEALRVDIEKRYKTYNDAHNSNLANIFQWLEWYILTGVRTSNIPGTSGFLGTGVDVTFENLNRRGFSALRVTPRYRLTSHYLRFLPVELSTGVDGTIVLPSQNVRTGREVTRYANLPSGRAVFWVTGLSVALDFRDSPMDPREGLFLALKGEYVHSLDKYTEQQDDKNEPVSRYIRFIGSLSGYIPFVDKRNVLALSTTIGYIFHFNNKSIAWADRYFYMGGVSTLRGFRSDTLRPEDIPPSYNTDGELVEEFGGEAMFLLRAELRHDFGKNILGVLFCEGGNLWRDTENFLADRKSRFSSLRLRPTAGVGFHYNTPVGPLAFDVGVNLNRNKELKQNLNSGQLAEALWAWYFSIGSAF